MKNITCERRPLIDNILIVALLVCAAFGLTSCNTGGSPTSAKATSTASAGTNIASSTTGPSPTPAHCLVGTWEIKDRKSFLYASVPVGALEPSDLDFVGTVGSIGLRFSNDGKIAVQADNFMGRFDVKIDEEINILDITMNGFVSGQYQLDGNKLTILDIQRDEMTYNATLADEMMMSETQANKFLPLFVEPYTHASVSCSLETLTIAIVNFPNHPGPLEFTRLR